MSFEAKRRRVQLLVSSSIAARLAGLAVAAVAATAVSAAPASAYFVQPCSKTGPEIQLRTYTSPISGLSSQYVSAGNQCYAANSTVSVEFTATWTYFGGTSWTPEFVSEPINASSVWPPVLLRTAPCQGSINTEDWQTESIRATNDGATSNTVTITIPPCPRY
jgi:hypothetical protein